ncbi:MAG: YfhO family protein [Candidatus Zixiibacteriota bacterium]|nr:MAG: YfhO family protein [candidate division Zixibacteria bacterium]
MKKDRKDQPKRDKLSRFENSSYFIPVSFAVIFIAVVIQFREFIFSDKIFHSGDLINAGFFFRSFFESYGSNNWAMPKWNPYIFGGMPFVDAFHGDIFYPFSKLIFVGSIFKMLCWNLILHIYASGIFMYLCARQLKLSKIAALMSAIAYMFSPFLISLIAPLHDGKIFVTSLFPLTIFFLDRAFEKKTLLNFSIYGLVIGLIILTPHVQMAYFTLWANALYTVYKLIILYVQDRSIKKVASKGLLTVYAVVIGLMISAIQFYPGYIYTKKFSPRSEAKKGWQWATSWSLHEEEAFSLIIPEFAGTNTSKAQTYYWGKNPFKDNSETAGIVPLFLALLALVCYRRKESYFFGGLALFSLIYGLGANTPFFRLFYYLIPMVKSLRAPSMIMFLFAFSIAVLAGMGAQYLLDRKQKITKGKDKALKYIIFGFPGLLLLFAILFSMAGRPMLRLWTSLFYSDASATMVQRGISKFDLAIMNLPAIQAGAWFGFFFALIAAVCVWSLWKRKAGILVIIVLLLVPVINSLRFNSRFITVFDYKPYIRTNPVVNFLSKDKTKYRVHDFTQNNRLNLAYHGIELVTGYHGNQLKWYDQLLGGPSQRNITNPRLLNLVGTKYIILPPNQRIPDNYFGLNPVLKALDFSDGQLIRNDNAFPRVYLVDSVRVLSGSEQADNLVLNGNENLRNIVYLEEKPDLKIGGTDPDSDSAWIISYTPDSVLIGTNVRNNGILVLTDNYYDSWNVYIDGSPAKLLRAYGSFRAAAVPGGAKKVLFRYESERYKTGKAITMATMLYLVLVLGYFSLKGVVPKIKTRK